MCTKDEEEGTENLTDIKCGECQGYLRVCQGAMQMIDATRKCSKLLWLHVYSVDL